MTHFTPFYQESISVKALSILMFGLDRIDPHSQNINVNDYLKTIKYDILKAPVKNLSELNGLSFDSETQLEEGAFKHNRPEGVEAKVYFSFHLFMKMIKQAIREGHLIKDEFDSIECHETRVEYSSAMDWLQRYEININTVHNLSFKEMKTESYLKLIKALIVITKKKKVKLTNNQIMDAASELGLSITDSTINNIYSNLEKINTT